MLIKLYTTLQCVFCHVFKTPIKPFLGQFSYTQLSCLKPSRCQVSEKLTMPANFFSFLMLQSSHLLMYWLTRYMTSKPVTDANQIITSPEPQNSVKFGVGDWLKKKIYSKEWVSNDGLVGRMKIKGTKDTCWIELNCRALQLLMDTESMWQACRSVSVVGAITLKLPDCLAY